jgi:uncharacterized repeat protein (TIGR01451 family)
LSLPVALLAASSESGACAISGGVADCALGSLAPDTTRNVIFRVQGTNAGIVSTSLRVLSDNDGLASNNLRTLRLRFAPGADMAAGLTLDTPGITVGGVVNAVITLDNRGPADVTDARVVITLPAGLTLQSQTVEGLTCASVTEGLTCGPQALANGGTGRLNLVLRGDVAGTFTLSAAASSSAPEIQSADNLVQRTVQVNAVPVTNPGTSGGGGSGGGGSLPAGVLAMLAALATAIARMRRQGAAVAAAKYFAR